MRNTYIYKGRLKNNLLAIAVIIVLLAAVIPAYLQPVIASEEGQLELDISGLPPKGNPKLDSALNRMVAEQAPSCDDPLMMQHSVQAEETVRVIIEGHQGQANAIAGAVAGLGIVEASYGDYIQISLPVSQLTAVAGMGNVRLVREPMVPLPAVTSEGVPLINADDWQSASYNGTGVKVGILDTGFSGYASLLGSELSASVNTWWAPSIGGPGNEVHGTACAEIVYDIAPAAEYYFANFNSLVEYGNAVEWLVDQGVDVISCSVGWPTGGPGNGTGTVCQIVDFAEAAGITWVQSAGNQARMHWRGDYTNLDSDYWHEFSGGDELNTINVSAGIPIVASLKWNDPWGTSINDFDLLLYDNTYTLVAYSARIQDGIGGDDDPWEQFVYTAQYSGDYYLAISTFGSPAVRTFHLYTYYHELEYQTASSSLIPPADSFSAVAVGAVDYNTPGTLESFSSRGPTDDGRIKPDLVAPDDVSTVSYGTAAFDGTSAAAPHVAGGAILVKQRFPSYGPAQIQPFLEGRAIDLDIPGKDNSFGSGRLDLGTASSNFTLTITACGNGIVMPSPGTYPYAEGTVVSVNATPASDWQFSTWAGDVSDATSANTTVTMDSDKLVTAYFSGEQLTSEIIVFDSARDGVSSDIYRMNADGSSQTRLTFSSSMDANPSLSADCSKIAFGSRGNIYVMNSDGSNQHSLTSGGYPAWSPDGSKIAFSVSGINFENIYTMNSDGSNRTQLTFSGWNRMPSWSPDGTKIAFTSWVNGRNKIFIMNSDGSNPTRLTMGDGAYQEPAWSPDGTKIAYTRYTSPPTIEVVNIDGSNQVTLGTGVCPSWSADGTRIALADSGVKDIFIMNADGSNRVKLTNTFGDDTHPSFAGTWGPPSYTLTMVNNGSGSTTPIIGSHKYTSGTTVDISATPSANWEFTNWTGAVSDNTSETTTVTMNSGKTVIANFHRVNSVLRITSNGSGDITPALGSYTYPVGSTVNLTATNTTNWDFVNWDGDVFDTNLPTTNITMNWDKTVTANFSRTHSTLSMAVSGSGTVTPVVGDHTYDVGYTVNITATPASGWQFNNWTGNVSTTANVSSANTTITMNGDYTIAANFSQIFTPTPSGGGGGGGGARGLTAFSDSINPEGLMVSDVTALSSDVQAYIVLTKGTLCLDSNGAPVYWIYFKVVEDDGNLPAPPEGSVVITPYYEIDPAGTTFDPSVACTFRYKLWGLLDGANPDNLVVMGWDTVNGQWVPLETQVDAENQSVTVMLNHLSLYTVMLGSSTADNSVPPEEESAPAAFEVSSLSVYPREVDVGDEVEICVIAANIGEAAGIYDVILNINGEIIETRNVDLAGGVTEEIVFTIIPETAGKKIIQINGLLGSLVVAGEVPPPEHIPLPAGEPGPSPELEPAPESEQEQEPVLTSGPVPAENLAPEPVNEVRWWIFAVIVGGLAIAALAGYLFWWRKRGTSGQSPAP